MNKSILILIILVFSKLDLNACHIMGADITYKVLDSTIGKYRFTLTTYRSCACINYNTYGEQIRIRGSYVTKTDVWKPYIDSQNIDVTPVCKVPDVPAPIQTNCPGMTPIGSNGIKGVAKCVFYYDVILGKNQNYAYVGWYSCCRNTEITTIYTPSSESIWVQAVVNTNIINNSPIFTTNPVPYFCRLRENTYSHGTTDQDSDAYVTVDGKKVKRDFFTYELYTPFNNEAGNTTIAANMGNPGVNFIPPLNKFYPLHTTTGTVDVDPKTGTITCIPSTIQDAIMAIAVKEYRIVPNANGIGYTTILLGIVCRDIEFTVRDICDPIHTIGVIPDSLVGANYVNYNTVDVCGIQKTRITFKIVGAQGQYLKSKVWRKPLAKNIPNFVYKERIKREYNVDTLIGTITFDSTVGIGFDIFELEAYYCATVGMRINKFYTLKINYRPAVTTDPLKYYCTGGKPLRLTAKGDSMFSWYPKKNIVGAKPNDSAWIDITPDSSRTYYVKGKFLDPTTSCSILDSVRVILIPKFNYTLSPKVSDLCLHDTVSILLNTQIADTPYKYTWTDPTIGSIFHPITNKKTTSIASPKLIAIDNATYKVEIESRYGCILTDSIKVNLKGVISNATALSARPMVCPGDTTLVSVTVSPKTSGPTIYTSIIPSKIVEVKNATQSNYPDACNLSSPNSCYPNPFSTIGPGQASSTRIIYKKSELVAAGLKPGIIKSIGFHISNVVVGNFDNFELRIGSTSSNIAASLNIPMYSVYKTNNLNVSQGWNPSTIFNFTRGFDWDGNSNIVIETHISHSTPITISNEMLTMSSPVQEVAFKYSDVIGESAEKSSKPYTSSSSLISKPQVRFEYIPVDSSNTTILNTIWSPISKIMNLTSPRAIATVSQSDSIFTAVVGTTQCYDTAVVKIKIDTNFKVKIQPGKRVYCMTGSTQPTVNISSIVTGSVSTTISWTCLEIPSFSANTANISTSLGIGTYHFVIYGIDTPCSARDTVVITVQNSIPLAFNIDSPLCTSNTGCLSAILPAGTSKSDYIFNWSCSSNTVDNKICNLAPGNCSLIIKLKSDTLCQGSNSAILSAKNITLNMMTSSSGILCHGGNADSITATASHSLGSGNYSYSWNTSPVSNTRSIYTMPLGNYTVTATDNITGCMGSMTFNQSEPSLLKIDSIQKINVLCKGGNTGSVKVFASGGTLNGGSYIYQWTGKNTLNTLSNFDYLPSLYADSLQVTVTDVNGCTVSGNIIVTELSNTLKIDTTIEVNPTSLPSTNGSIKAIISGGSPNYTYKWYNISGVKIKPDVTKSDTFDSASGLAVGVYKVVVTDASGCITVEKICTLKINCAFRVQYSVDSVLCHGDSSGKIHIGAVDSLNVSTTSWYQYSLHKGVNISSPLLSTIQKLIHFPLDTAHFTNLFSGIYTIRIQTDKGCDTTIPMIDIFQNPTFTTIDSPVMPSCHGYQDGKIYISATGNFSPFTYNFGSGFQSKSFDTNQNSGFKIVQVKNALGCIQNQGYTVPTPDSIAVSISPDTPYVRCKSESNALATILVGSNNSSILSTLSYHNKPGSNSNILDSTLAGMSSGAYQIQVRYTNLTNGVQCATPFQFQVKDPDTLVISSQNTNPSCSYNQDGVIIGKLISKGNPPSGTNQYSYEVKKGSWSQTINSNLDTFKIDGLDSGIYSIKVTDAKGCTDSKSILLTKPDSFIIGVSVIDASCLESKNGSILVDTFVGGNPTANYSYHWTMNDLISGATSVMGSTSNPNLGLRGLASYTVKVTDSKGCIANKTVIIDTIYKMKINSISIKDANCFGSLDGKITVNSISPSYLTGLKYTFSSDNTAIDSNFKIVGAGTYNITVTDGKGCGVTDAATVSQPDDILIIGNMQNAKCHNEASGSIKINISGGSPAYLIPNWNNGSQFTDSAVDLKAGIHSVKITDAHGCTKTASFTILEPLPFIAEIESFQNISCYAMNDGRLTVKTKGGIPNLNYSWNQGITDNSSNLTNLKPANYRVTITDANGCTATTNQTISEPNKLEFEKIKTDSVSCPRYADGSIDISAKGGTISTQKLYEYSIDGGASFYSDGKFSNLPPADYNVIVRDNNNCIAVQKVPVGEPEELFIVAKKSGNTDTLTMGNQVELYYDPSTKSGTLPNIISTTWSPKISLSCIECPRPMAFPYNTTEFFVDVRYHKNCNAESKIKIPVYDPLDFFVPNAFTPTSDGLNDTLFVYGNGIKSLLFQVYNRWGEKVFESNHISKGCDGKFLGENQPTAVYTYVAEVIYLNGIQKMKKGSVTLIR